MPLNPFAKSHKQSGLTLIEALVALAASGVVLAVVSTMAANSYKIYAKMNEAMDLEQVRFAIRTNMNCVRTVASMPSPCPSGKGIQIKSTSQVLAEAYPKETKLGSKYYVSAICVGSAKQFRVRVRREGSTTLDALFNADMVCP